MFLKPCDLINIIAAISCCHAPLAYNFPNTAICLLFEGSPILQLIEVDIKLKKKGRCMKLILLYITLQSAHTQLIQKTP